MTTPTTSSLVAGANNSVTVNGSMSTVTPPALLPNTSFHNSVTNTSWSFTSTSPPVTNSTVHSDAHLPHPWLKDHTTMVAVIVMGVIVPVIFIAVVVLICRQRRRDLAARRNQMLLQNAQDFALDDYTSLDKSSAPPPRL